MAIFTLYAMSDKLLIAVKNHLRLVHNYKLGKPAPRKDETIGRLWEKLVRLDYYFFPDEYSLKYPKIKANGNLYTLSYPHGDRVFKPKRGQISVAYHADGYSRKFKVPEYWSTASQQNKYST